MRRTVFAVVAAVVAAALVGPVGSAAAANAPAARAHHAGRVCARAAAGTASCEALVQEDSSGKPLATTTPSGFGPADIRSAYALTTSSSGGRTVAIVDAFNDSTAEADLGVYRAHYGLSACTTANGCFHKVGQAGGAVPTDNASWAQEISLDL